MQAQYLGRLTPDMDVCDIDGQKIGTISRVYRDEFATALHGTDEPAETAQPARSGVVEVKTGLLGLGEHLFIPIGAIQDATEQCVFVGHKKDQLAEEWHHKPDYLDQLQ
jgi:hypothetical protein